MVPLGPMPCLEPLTVLKNLIPNASPRANPSPLSLSASRQCRLEQEVGASLPQITYCHAHHTATLYECVFSMCSVCTHGLHSVTSGECILLGIGKGQVSSMPAGPELMLPEHPMKQHTLHRFTPPQFPWVAFIATPL